MAKLNLKAGTTSQLAHVYLQSTVDGSALTGLVFNSSGLTAYYLRDGDSSATAISLVTATVGTWTSGGFKEVDSTNMPGLYEIGLPNAVLANAGNVVVLLKGATNLVPNVSEIQCAPVPPDLSLANGVETGLTLQQALRAMAAVLVGTITDAATTTNIFKDAGGNGNTRVTATVDSSGDRSAVTITA